ncbi:uncharacterized protein TrAFT101_004866 [Trichoderma asperellum]|nr:hypothetical protein TrAFT101_004866 [Trichoderma asperellum]
MLEYAFHHIFLPPKLPNGDDRSPANELCLIELVRDSLTEFLPKTDASNHDAIKSAVALMKNMHYVTGPDGYLQEDGVRAVLKQIGPHSPSKSLASLHITAQNAGVMLRLDNDSVTFEMFELCPTSGSVYSTKGRLIRQFPAVAVCIPVNIYAEDDFQDVLAKTLVKMSYQTVSEALPKTKKAKQYHAEERDTVDPKIVTELLYGFLRGIGSEANVAGITKNTREEVLWEQSKLPWRRSAVWLLIRVSLQLTMDRVAVGSEELYKSFIIFLLSRVLNAATNDMMVSEILMTMSAKISRRLLKLGHPANGTWLTDVHETVSIATKFVDDRWYQIRNEAKSQFDLTSLQNLNMAGDTSISIPGLKDFISSISERRNGSQVSSFCPKSGITAFGPEKLPSISGQIDKNECPFYLAMVESWVATHLSDWIKKHVGDDSACIDLFNLMQNYHAVGRGWYSSRPEGASRMILVILELWVAADKAAIHEFPQLEKFEHEIPIEVFQSLLFGFRRDMERLHLVQTYLTKRRDLARPKKNLSIFSSYGQRGSFPVEYFSQSPAHQNLLIEIEARAYLDKQAKLEEYRLCRAQYETFMRHYEQGVCERDGWWEDGVWYTEHASDCKRCAYRTKAVNMSINVYEWPLSSSPREAQATVFELALPDSFGAWRDGTLYVIDDVLQSMCSQNEKLNSEYPLRSYAGLGEFFRSNSRRRIHLLSESKPHVATHRKNIKIGHSTESDVCVNNGLQLRYFDENRRTFVETFTASTWLSELCTFRLGKDLNQLKRFLVRTHDEPTGEAPNAVIASQAFCPENMSLGEYKALATLPFGYRLQWMSILTQLAMPDVDFNKFETAIFLLQLSLQAGPNEHCTVERCAHGRLTDAEFGRAMLDQLQLCVSRIKENWESHTAMWIFVFLAARLLSMTTTPDLNLEVFNLLKKCREISYEWLARLRSRAYDSPNEDERVQFLQIAFRVSLLCADTFNVDDELLACILSEPRQAAILIEISININNNTSLVEKDQDELEKIMYDRWIFTMHRSRPMLSDEILCGGNSCLDRAIKRCWPDFSRIGKWSLVNSTCSWLETVSAELKIHVNLLTGELLVNGSPLSRLPRKYEVHKDYQKLFGAFVLDVMPSSSHGMKFCSSKDLEGYVAHFSMEDTLFSDEDLMVRLDGQDPVLDLIPSRLFTGWLPNSFIDDYTHWYNQATGSIEFRPTGDPWKPSTQGWILSQHKRHWKLTRAGNISLLSPGSSSARYIASIFSPLDTVLHLHMLLDAKTGNLEIKVTRLQLEFTLKKGESVIVSRQFRGMQIDSNQYIGTLIGFNSKLVMKDIHNSENRMVIIPEGNIDFEAISEGHVHVDVAYGTANRVQRYLIDNQLRHLVGNATAQSKLYLAYIHALTSYCIPDPFLGRTGTEESLSILASASIRSLDCLTPDNVQVLQVIANLSPCRDYYPKHIKHMQTVRWSPVLSFMAQDSRFYNVVNSILDNVSDMSFLYPSDEAITVELAHNEMDLVHREIFRSSRYQVSGFGAEDFNVDYDVKYSTRDRGQSSAGTTYTLETTFRVHNNIKTVGQRAGEGFLDILYDLLSGPEETFASQNIPGTQEIQYGAEWLSDPNMFLPAYWCRLHFAFQTKPSWISKFQTMIWLATLAYSSKRQTSVLQAIMMLPLSTELAAVPLPVGSAFKLSEGYTVKMYQLENLVRSATRDFGPGCPEMKLSPYKNESQNNTRQRRKTEFNNAKGRAVTSFVNRLAIQWPNSDLVTPNESWFTPYIKISSAMALVKQQWRVWLENLRFREYLERFILTFNAVELGNVYIPRILRPIYQASATRPRGYVSIDDVFCNTSPVIGNAALLNRKALQQAADITEEANNKLVDLLDHLSSRIEFDYERQYISELRKSLLDLGGLTTMRLERNDISSRSMTFENYLQQCKSFVQECYGRLLKAVLPESTCSHLGPDDSSTIIRSIISAAGFHPRACPIFFLQQLGRHRWPSLTEAWQKTIITYAIAITSLQQAQRLVNLQDNEVDLLKELENTCKREWDPCQHPEWLLLECESGIIIRHVQHQIAEQMISPQDNENAVMQLNMGEGKSSVIVPIAATALSNGSQIVRVIVAKPQVKQMHLMLMSKLSGLLDRPIFRMPFSRAVQMNENKAEIVNKLARRCMEEGGILLVQPEHILSFQLMGLECAINGRNEIARPLLETQRLFNVSSRDIVDESDENFSVKFELVYTIGKQRPIEHTPERWVVIQNVLSRFARICLQLKTSFPESLDVDDRYPERFPRIRILRSDAEAAILTRLAEFICNTGMSGFPIAQQCTRLRNAVNHYISNIDLKPKEIDAVEQSLFWGETTADNILLLRGLLSGGILSFAFGQKRWRVDYGTHPNREKKTRLAVPFRAKDNPTPRSEFSHPDVVIVLTCLSYYYKGLQDEELFEALELLVRSDNPDLEYRAWVESAPGLPPCFRHLTGINVRDRTQCISDVFPHLRYSKGCIDYFLSRIVFAKESREFPHKLSASGWDLGKRKINPTTGFSGTNDSRYILPMDIKQLDLPEQNHTNALVLNHLLRSENGIMLMPKHMKGANLESESLLEMVSQMSSKTRVILDVGAQVIDLDNRQFAEAWLKRYHEDDSVQAVVFFNEADELMVLDRSNKVELLQTSPFATQLDQCLVFLDEAHTRGTDLRLPTNYQAAVTLGANLTKDKLVQACMRMRKLGRGQSVVFCISREIEQKIQAQRDTKSSMAQEILVSDVLCWAITETWRDLRRMVPLWLTQGVRYYEQESIWNDGEQYSHDMETWAKKFLETEAQSLKARYRPKTGSESAELIKRARPAVKFQFQRRCEEFGLMNFCSSSLQEEQERELSPETEQERQVEQPSPALPEKHSCHPDLRSFIKLGGFPVGSDAFKPAFQALKRTSAVQYFDIHEFPTSIWVTEDFSKTVKMENIPDNGMDLFQRPVHWILTSKLDSSSTVSRLVIISPWEAHQLMPYIEASEAVTLHLYAPRSNLGFRPLDQLVLYTVPHRPKKSVIPPGMMVELNIFAGQLYLSSFEEYIEVCNKLGLACSPADDSVVLRPDGFIPPGVNSGNLVNKSEFKKSPVQFIKVLVTKIRRNCEVVEKTHLGKILDGVLLTEEDFEEDVD